MAVVLGDFNVKLNSCYANDNTNIEGLKIDILTASFGFNQIINEPCHILNNSSSCIDLIFTSKLNLVIESGVHSSFHANCHHQITQVKFALNVIYSPLYAREVWHYKLANSDSIQCAIDNFDWEKAFHNVDVNKQIMLFNETALNVSRNFIPHETVIFESYRIKKMINKKKLLLNFLCIKKVF